MASAFLYPAARLEPLRRFQRLGRLLLLTGSLGLVSFAAAEEKAKDAGSVIYPRPAGAQAEPAAGRTSGYSTVLVFAVLLAGAGGWVLWRNRSAPRSGATLRQLAIAETKSLGNRQFLVVATYQDKKFLLGVCPGRIDLLTPLDATTEGKSS